MILNVLVQTPGKRDQPKARVPMLLKIPYADTVQRTSDQLRKTFVAQYPNELSKATLALQRDWERMITLCDFP